MVYLASHRRFIAFHILLSLFKILREDISLVIEDKSHFEVIYILLCNKSSQNVMAYNNSNVVSFMFL